jgi:hypothetical protein
MMKVLFIAFDVEPFYITSNDAGIAGWEFEMA